MEKRVYLKSFVTALIGMMIMGTVANANSMELEENSEDLSIVENYHIIATIIDRAVVSDKANESLSKYEEALMYEARGVEDAQLRDKLISNIASGNYMEGISLPERTPKDNLEQYIKDYNQVADKTEQSMKQLIKGMDLYKIIGDAKMLDNFEDRETFLTEIITEDLVAEIIEDKEKQDLTGSIFIGVFLLFFAGFLFFLIGLGRQLTT